jgi:hypothetical protein
MPPQNVDTAVSINAVNPMNASAASGATAGAAAGKAAAATGAGFWTTKAVLIAVGSVVGAGALIGGLAGGLTAKKDSSATTNGGTNTDGEGDNLFGGDDDGPRSWKELETGHDGEINAIRTSHDGKHVWIATRADLQHVYMSSDYGATWTKEFYAQTSMLFSIDISKDGRCIVVGRSERVGVSLNGGAWKTRDLDTLSTIVGVAISDDCRTVVVADEWSEKVWISYDGLDTLEAYELDDSQFEDFTAIACDAQCDKIIVTTDDGYMFMSNDKGKSFERVGDRATDMETWNPGFNCVAISDNGQSILAVSGEKLDNHYRYFSLDGGETWSQVDGEEYWLSCAVSPDGKYFVAGNEYSLYWTTTPGGTWIQDQPSEDEYRAVACDRTCNTMYAGVPSSLGLLKTLPR